MRKAIGAVVNRLRCTPDFTLLSGEDRRLAIQIAMMSVDYLDPDDREAIRDVEVALAEHQRRSLIDRVSELTGLTDMQLAKEIGKSRATTQAYKIGRIPEALPPPVRRQLARLLEEVRKEYDAAIAELKGGG